jgi:hypothetical protein
MQVCSGLTFKHDLILKLTSDIRLTQNRQNAKLPAFGCLHLAAVICVEGSEHYITPEQGGDNEECMISIKTPTPTAVTSTRLT